MTGADRAPKDQAPTTLVQVLLRRAAQEPDRPAITVSSFGGQRTTLTVGQLISRSLELSTSLRSRGMRQGDRVFLCLPTGPEILYSIFGVMLGGGVCVPVYPPVLAHGLERWRERVRALTRVAQPCGAITVPQGKLHMAAVLEQHGPDLFTVTPDQLGGDGRSEAARVLPTDLAFIQFTSGTTRGPRGVSVSHAALMANMRAMTGALGLTGDDVSVSWLPPYHDMGLVGHVFVPLLLGAHQHLMAPRAFLRDPAEWLRLIGETGATQTTAPNFAFSMCAARVKDPAGVGADLSSLRQVLNGAELVQLSTMTAFGEAFAPLGFRPEVFRPVYGLAECTLAATISPPGGPRIDWVHRQRLADRDEARPMARRAEGARSFVGVGPAVEGHELKLLGRDGQRCSERQVGEIYLRGPSVMSGYFNNPQATQQVLLEGGWLRTGDLGYLAGGQLFVTGRRKELIIKAGRNYLPEDFEAACLPVMRLRPGRAVAFGVPNAVTGTEDLVLVAEVRDPALAGNPLLRERVAQAVTKRTGLRPDRLELIQPGVLPKTTSGKLQRTKVRAAFEAGQPLQAPRPSLTGAVRGSVRSAAGLLQARMRRLLGWQ